MDARDVCANHSGQVDTLRESLDRALANKSALVQIVTWNDFGEGTTIEPTKEYGFRDLNLIREMCLRKSGAEANTSIVPLETARLARRTRSPAP